MEMGRSKYYPLFERLMKQKGKHCRLTFDEINEIIDGSLPPSAYKRLEWWGNDRVSHTQSRAWLDARWEVCNIDLGNYIEFKKIELFS